MVSEDEKGSKRREDVGTCWPLGVMLAEEPLDESEITRRARGGSLRNEVVPEDFKPKRLALGCSERPRLLPLFSQSGFCLGEFRECEGDCFGRLPPAASTLEEWRGRRVCWRANGGMAESLDTCPMSMVAAVLRRRNVKMHELTTRSTTKTNELQQKNKKTLHVLVGTAASTTQGTMFASVETSPIKLLSPKFRSLHSFSSSSSYLSTFSCNEGTSSVKPRESFFYPILLARAPSISEEWFITPWHLLTQGLVLSLSTRLDIKDAGRCSKRTI